MEISEPSNEAPTMLIADDDPSIVRLLASRCAKMGFKVETATNGMQALFMVRRNPPDVLMVDVNMPQLDGLSICARVLAPGKKPVHVVVVTGSQNPDTVERCKSFGAFYGQKGPKFWSSIRSALTAIYPRMADKINEHEKQSSGIEVHERPRVLVIDDDPDVEIFLSSRLAKCGVDTLHAPDAVQGYRIACKEEPSAIISDCFMPNGDALYLLWRLRTTPATANIPVIVMTGRRLDEQTQQSLMREVCGRPGASLILSKSFDTDELFRALQKFCGFEKHRTQDGSGAN